ncbi:MAG: hypothetical protein J6C85_04740 [Alphaproteobacteria bacterium]|nr:hypothetical protein [Alphaproteobacteria bacterium]
MEKQRRRFYGWLGFGIGLVLLIVALAWEKAPKRCVVFAGYNAEGRIAGYVLSYLKALNEIAPSCVIYIADSTLKEGEEKKLDGLVLYTEHKRHNEYDWGSYKRGFNWLKENGYLDKIDELVFANDSCYAPLSGSFEPMFKKMAGRKELDFWGDLQNTAFNPHVQSYFMVFRKKVICSRAFAAFLNSVQHQAYSSYYIQLYETALTPRLESLGYKWDSYMPYQKLSFLELGDKNSYPLTMIRDFGHEFLKRRTFTNNLAIMEDKKALLELIKERYPERYEEIMAEIKQ